MISSEHKEILEQLGKSPFAKKLKEFLADELTVTNDVTTSKSWDETLERKGRAKFIKEFLRLMQEKEEVGKIPNQYT